MQSFFRYLKSDTIRAFQFYQGLRFSATLLFGIILVQSGFSQKEVGEFEFFLFVINFFSFFWSMGLKNALLSYCSKRSRHETRLVLSSVSYVFVFFSIIASLVLYIYAYSDPTFPVHLVYYMIAALCLGTISDLVEMILIIRNKPSILFYEAIVFYIAYIVLLLVFISIRGSMFAAILVVLSWRAYRFIYFLFLFFQLGHKFSWKHTRPFLLFSFPLMLQVLLGNGMEYVDGYIISQYFGKGTFAAFRFGAREMPLNNILVTSLAMAAIPIVARYPEKGTHLIKTRLSRLMDWLFPLSAILMVSSKYVYEFVYNSSYVLSAQIFNVYLLLIITRVLLAQVFIYSNQKNYFLLVAAVIEIILNVTLSLIFIQWWGVMGVVYATLVAYVAEKLLLILYNYFYLNIKVTEYLDLRRYIGYSVMLIAIYFMTSYLEY